MVFSSSTKFFRLGHRIVQYGIGNGVALLLLYSLVKCIDNINQLLMLIINV